jgi:hypothetical protein
MRRPGAAQDTSRCRGKAPISLPASDSRPFGRAWPRQRRRHACARNGTSKGLAAQRGRVNRPTEEPALHVARACAGHAVLTPTKFRGRGGRDESERRRAESQWIVAARPLCHLQYPVAYLSRLQRILPAARWELRFKAAAAALPPRGLGLRHVPLGTERSLLRVGKRTAGERVALARILT